MTFVDHKKFWRRLEREHPQQDYTHQDAVLHFLRDVKARKVVELGGWKGDLASYVLEQESTLTGWVNFDFAPGPIVDPRYVAVELQDFFWNEIDLTGFDTFVAGHVLEHLKARDLKRVLDTIAPVKHAYIEMPILESATNARWGGLASHILEIGWKQVETLFEEHNFHVVVRGHDVAMSRAHSPKWRGFSR
jgi:hypothetical protein